MRTLLFSFLPLYLGKGLIKYSHLLCLSFALLMFQGMSAQQVLPIESGRNLKISAASIIGVWAEHNQFVDGQMGVLIHVSFNTYNTGGKPCSIMTHIQYGNNQALMNQNEEYASFQGIVSIVDFFTPASDNSHYSDYSLFIPFYELPLDGNYQLTYRVFVKPGNGRIAKSADQNLY